MSDATHWTLDSLPIGVWVGSVPTGEVVYFNPAFRVIVGMEPVTGSRIDDVPITYHVCDRQGRPYPVERLPFARAIAEARSVVVDDMVLHRSDGRQIHLRAFAIPKFDGNEVLTEVVVVFVDITREVAVEAERDRVNTHLHLVVNHSPIAIWAADLEGNVTLSEGAGLIELGFQPGELVGRNLFELYGGHPTVPGYIRRGLAGESFFYSVTVGNLIYDTWLISIRDASGTQTGIAAMSTNVTEVRQLQGRAIQHDHQAAMGMLAASVAHEINNPLTYVLGSADSLERQVARLEGLVARTPEIDEALARIRTELAPIKDGASRIATITRDLRTFSRPDDERSEIRIDDVLRSTLQLVGKEVAARARLVVDLAADAVVYANHARLLQVFLNLMSNAVQALPASGDHEIHVATRLDDARVLIEISDTGPGVPADLRERIFEPFVTTKEVGKGTGLGLFVCRNIVRSLGGTIDVRGHPGGGAVFQVALPTQDPGPVRVPEPPPAMKPTPTRILVIDDDPMVLRALVGQLATNPNYTVVALEDGNRALALLQHETFDLIYCDLMMRGLTGMALERTLREQGSANVDKLVFMTGGAFTPAAQAFVRANAARVVDKPLDIVAETERRTVAR